MEMGDIMSPENLKKMYLLENIRICAPREFDLSKFFDASYHFLSDVESALWNSKQSKIYLDFSSTEVIARSSFLYLYAIIDNQHDISLRKSDNNIIKFKYPTSSDANQILSDFRFYGISSGNLGDLRITHNNQIIISDNTVNNDIAAQICDFVFPNKSNIQLIKVLYSMLIELMENTVQHAYIDMNFMTKKHNKWYIYVKKLKNRSRFVFLDIGLGIPSTISKKRLEKVKKVFVSKTDAELIMSALGEKDRSSTKLSYRGKGLRSIYNAFLNQDIAKLDIMSNNGRVILSQDDPILTILDENFTGSMLSWSITKEE